ncbi:MAG TPA: PHB depolymerase family esterase [Polyangiaceae bacterium]|nr:PHB depolymerase family esterase [Polyangiaceae bacterium]
MNERALAVALVGVGLGLASVGCSRADVYPITEESQEDAGSRDAGSEPSACPSTVLPPGDETQSVSVGGVSRSYVLHVPSSYDGKKPAPLVIDFHGVGGSGQSELSGSPYPELLDAEGVVMAFPDGLKGPAGTAWNVGPCCVADVDDVGFARALVAQVSESACIDARRVYAVGVLTGGGMAQYLACRASDVFAAVAPAAFDLLEENVSECNPARAVSVVSFRGTADTRVPYAGGPSSVVPGMPVTFLGAQATFEKWAQIDHCTGAASAEDAQGCARYSGCEGGAEVILCTKQGGREEPGDANIAWPVLKRHTL